MASNVGLQSPDHLIRLLLADISSHAVAERQADCVELVYNYLKVQRVG